MSRLPDPPGKVRGIVGQDGRATNVQFKAHRWFGQCERRAGR